MSSGCESESLELMSDSPNVLGWWAERSEIVTDLLSQHGVVPCSTGSFPDAAGEATVFGATDDGPE